MVGEIGKRRGEGEVRENERVGRGGGARGRGTKNRKAYAHQRVSMAFSIKLVESSRCREIMAEEWMYGRCNTIRVFGGRNI